jgi:heme oxygenase
MDLIRRIREATAGIHDRLERLPLAQALVTGTVTRAAYGRLLTQLLAVHQPLESGLAGRPEWAPVFGPDQVRAPALRRDLAALGTGAEERVGPTRRLVATLDQWAAATPWRLLGGLYVLEGSRQGSRFLVRALARGLGVPAAAGFGLDYHLEGQADRLGAWPAWLRALDALPLAPARQADVAAAAAAVFEGLHAIYAALGPAPAEPDPGRQWDRGTAGTRPSEPGPHSALV